MTKTTWALLACYLLIAATHFLYYPKWQQERTEATISYDVSGYYLYLPAAFIYEDLREVAFLPEIIEKYHPTYDPYQTFTHESGREVMKYSVGQAVIYLPFFSAAHGWASASSAYPADGFSLPYQFMISFGSIIISFLGLYWLARVLRHYFNDSTVAITLLLIGFGTNYLNYSAIDGAMTHNSVFTLYALLLLLTHHFYRSPTLPRAIGIGLVIGLMALTRPTEILGAVIPVLWGIRGPVSGRLNFFARNWQKLLAAALACLSVGSLQLIYWKYVTGDWIVYSYQDQGFDWLSPHLIDATFSYKAGWLVYTPMMAFALLGFLPLYRRSRPIFWATLVHSLLFIYVAFAWSIWWYGGSLGQRTMVQAYAILAFPLAAAVSWAIDPPRWVRWPFAGLALLFIAHNLWFTHQAHRGGLFFVEQMNRSYYWRTLFTFEENEEDQLLFDNPEAFRGTPGLVDTLYFNGLDQLDPSACGMGPVSGSGALCLLAEMQNSEEFRTDLPLERSQWIRAQADFKIDARRGNKDNFAQMVLRFYLNGEQVKQRIVRLHRVLNDDWRREVTMEARVPWDGADAVSVSFWNGGDTQPALVVDNVSLLRIE